MWEGVRYGGGHLPLPMPFHKQRSGRASSSTLSSLRSTLYCNPCHEGFLCSTFQVKRRACSPKLITSTLATRASPTVLFGQGTGQLSRILQLERSMKQLSLVHVFRASCLKMPWRWVGPVLYSIPERDICLAFGGNRPSLLQVHGPRHDLQWEHRSGHSHGHTWHHSLPTLGCFSLSSSL